MTIEPDTKDWTWVLERACSDCGFDPRDVDRSDIGARIRRHAALWPTLLAVSAAARRPDPATWSVLEYACHVRDVHRVFTGRLASMLDGDDPLFANWDQDQAAVQGRYAEQLPGMVGRELLDASGMVADVYDAVPDDGWARPGRRGNGSRFTVETLARYHLHDLDHHAWDVRAAFADLTRQAYDHDATAYAQVSRPSDEVVGRLGAFATAVGNSARILELGSGGGHDAAYLERAGISVRRTDVTPAFVDLNRAAGHRADRVDPLIDDLSDPGSDQRCPGTPYDGVWANACLLHVARADLPTVLTRLAVVARPGGVLALSVKEGDGEAWSTHGSIGSPRRFVYWRRGPLREACAGAGWEVEAVDDTTGLRTERWLLLTARRSGT